MRGQREKDDDKTAEVLDPEAASGKGRCEDRKKVGVGGRGVIQSLNCASAAPAVLLTACPGVSDRLVFLPDDCMLLKQ